MCPKCMSYSFAKQQMVIQATSVLKEIRYKNYRLFLLLTKLHIILKYKILPPPHYSIKNFWTKISELYIHEELCSIFYKQTHLLVREEQIRPNQRHLLIAMRCTEDGDYVE